MTSLSRIYWVVLVSVIAACSPSQAPSQKVSPEQVINDQLLADSDAAKIRAKEFTEASLKAPSTAIWPSYNEFATARAQDKKGQTIKDRWLVTGYVDAQNSMGAMLRTKFLVTLQKKEPEWQLVKLSTY